MILEVRFIDHCIMHEIMHLYVRTYIHTYIHTVQYINIFKGDFALDSCISGLTF
jgi:hypothetical protein